MDRAAKNEVLFRDVNERVREIAEKNGVTAPEQWEFLCECSMKVDCLERIKLSKDEYERLRSNPIHFAVVRGHERLEIERVVAENDGYLVVEKLPGAREIALAADPRS